MRTIKYIALLFSTAVLLTGCFENDYQHTMSDGDAFVAFSSTTASVNEPAGSIQVPVILTSVSQLAGTVTIEVDKEASTGIAGVNYVDPGAVTLTFPGGDASKATQYVNLQIVDNDIFTGAATVVLKITSHTGNFVLGNESTCTVTIVDDEHPLALILGDYVATGISNWDGEFSWNVLIEADEVSLTTVWIRVPLGFGSNTYWVSGTVNEDITEITVATPVTVFSNPVFFISYPETSQLVFTVDSEGNLTAQSGMGLRSNTSWYERINAAGTTYTKVK